MRFNQYQSLCRNLVAQFAGDGQPDAKYDQADARALPALVLAYIGDAYFNLFVRLRLLSFEQHKVRILHDFASRMVSAVMQSRALHELENELTDEELAVVRRGRNANSTVPKSASVSEYRYSTGFEALLGFMFVDGQEERARWLADRSFDIIARQLEAASNKNGGKK